MEGMISSREGVMGISWSQIKVPLFEPSQIHFELAIPKVWWLRGTGIVVGRNGYIIYRVRQFHGLPAEITRVSYRFAYCLRSFLLIVRSLAEFPSSYIGYCLQF